MNTVRFCLGALLAATVTGASAANTWWVDDDNYGKTGLDGTDAAKAFGTIQDALDNPSFAAGDTVKVLPGTYDRGETYNASSGMTNRIAVTKACTIVSTGGAAVTHIVGRHSADTTYYGIGPDAIRCIYANANPVRIEGFTLRDGASSARGSDNNMCHAAGLLGSNSSYQKLVDCVVSNCVAYKGVAARNATVIRTLMSANRVVGGDGSICNGSVLFACIARENASGYVCSTCTGYNCDILNNSSSTAMTGAGSFYNSFIAGNQADTPTDTRLKLYNCCLSNAVHQLVAPAWGDYRPIAGSELVGRGDAGDLSKASSVPAEDRCLDFDRQQLPTSGACNVGAVQTVQQVAGALQAGDGGLIVDGRLLPAQSWVFATSYPTQWVVRAVPQTGKWLYGFKRTSQEKDRFHPDLNDEALVMPPPTGVTTATTVYATKALWVNPNKDAEGRDIGSDDNDGTQASPLHTLQKAIDKTPDSTPTVIFAAPGFYAEGGKNIHAVQYNSSFLTNRVCVQSNGKHVRLLGAGAGKSFIVGAPDPVTGGNGPGAVRPVGVYCNYTTIQGFTLTNGYSAASTAAFAHDKYGAIYGRELQGVCVHVLDCEIAGCRGQNGAATRAVLTRCTFHDNEVTNSLLADCVAASCAIWNNRTGGLSLNTTFYNCTAIGRTREETASNGSNKYIASIATTGTRFGSTDELASSLVWQIATVDAKTKPAVGKPYFVDAENGDLRVRSFSPAVSCAGVPGEDNWGTNYWKFATSDFDGRPLTLTDGVPVAGCRQEVCEDSGILVDADEGGLSVPTGWQALADDATLTVAKIPGMRPCIGFVFGGETNLFEDAASRTFTAADCPKGALLEMIYTSDWYVDASKSDDSGDAFTPANAKKTFAGVFATGCVRAGDTVHAAEGTYDEGVMYRPETTEGGVRKYTVGARVIVPEGVTVTADGCVEATVIKGAAATGAGANGLGADAVRCVCLVNDACVRGFTLAGGRTDNNTAIGTDAAKEYPDNIGALAAGIVQNVPDPAKKLVVENCVLSDGIARRGGAAAYVNLVRCRVRDVLGVDSSGNAGGTLRCHHYGTVITDVQSEYAVMYPYSFVFSTVIDDVHSHIVWKPVANGMVRGSVIVGGGQAENKQQFVNCYFTHNWASNYMDGTSRLVSRDALKFDTEGRPVVGQNAVIDQGLVEQWEPDGKFFADVDASGVPRVMNGAIDVGALEADWRPVYARDVAASGKFAVTEVSSDVVETADRTVAIPDGETVTAVWRNTSGRTLTYTLSVKVPAAGTLTIYLNGEKLRDVTTEGTTDLTFEGPLAENVLAFDYAGAGAAELLASRCEIGTLLIVR